MNFSAAIRSIATSLILVFGIGALASVASAQKTEITGPPAGTINDATIVLSGSARAQGSVEIYDGSVKVGGPVPVANKKHWSVTVKGEGPHVLQAHEVSQGTAANATSKGVQYVLSSPAPVVSIDSPAAGKISNGSVVLDGSGEANSTVEIWDASLKIAGPIPVNPGGKWRVTINLATDGPHMITAKDISKVTGKTGVSKQVLYTLNRAPPAVSIRSRGRTVNVPGLAVSGDSEEGATIQLLDGIKEIGKPQTLAKGETAWRIVVQLDHDGPYMITARATSAAGTVGRSTPELFTLESPAPTIVIKDPPAGKGTNPRITVRGTAEPGTTVQLLQGFKEIGPTNTTTASGNWSITITFDQDGPHAITARGTNAASGKVGTSTPVVYTLETPTPKVAITSPATGTSSTMTLVKVAGTGNPGATVRIIDGSAILGAATTVASDGSWKNDVNLATDKLYKLEARLALGTKAVASNVVSYTLDRRTPVVAITKPGNGNWVKQNPVPVEGTGEPGATVNVWAGNKKVSGDAIVAANRTWSGAVNLPGDGAHNLTANSYMFSGGNIGKSASLLLNVKSVVPSIQITSPGQTLTSASPSFMRTITGTASSDSTVEVLDGGTRVVGPFPVPASGNSTWTANVPLNGYRTHQLTARVTDKAGNIGTSAPVNFVLNAPAAPPPPPPPQLGITVGTPYYQHLQGTISTPAGQHPGMRIVMPGSLTGAAGRQYNVTVFFYNDDGSVLLPRLGENSRYTSGSGNEVAAGTGDLTAAVNSIDIGSQVITIPYYALNFAATNYTTEYRIAMDVQVAVNGAVVARTNRVPMTFKW